MEVIEVMKLFNDICEVIDQVRDFKSQSNRLKDRISYITPSIKKLAEAKTEEGPKLFSNALANMLDLMERIRNFVTELKKKTFFERAVYKESISKDFIDFGNQLDAVYQAIQMGLAVEATDVLGCVEKYMDRYEENREDQLKDIANFKDNQMKEIANFRDNSSQEFKKLNEKIDALLKVAPKENDQKRRLFSQLMAKDGFKIRRSKITFGDKICTGHFGDIYEAEFQMVSVAVKSFPKEVEEERMIFLKEVVNLQRLSCSPHIVRLFGVIDDKEPNTIVMEYMKKGNLRKVLNEVDASELSQERRAQMALDGALGLYSMHTMPHPILHLNLSSDIFLVMDDWTVKVTAVGFAKTRTSLQKKSAIRHTKSNLKYVSPQRLESPNSIPTVSSEIYSYGIVMWEIATGSVPYMHENKEYTPSEIYEFVATERKMLPLPDDCHPDFKNLIDKCRHFDPIIRPNTSAVVDKLQKLRSTLCCHD